MADRTAAEAIRGALVGVPRAALPPTATDEYYWADLIGLDTILYSIAPTGKATAIKRVMVREGEVPVPNT